MGKLNDAYKILIADDHSALRAGVKSILSDAFASPIYFGEAGSGKEVMDLLRNEQWDLLILDISLPDMSGLDILDAIKARGITIKVAVFSAFGEQELALRCLKSGAHTYISKAKAEKELVEAVIAIKNGKTYFPPTLLETVKDHIFESKNSLPHQSLSKREFQIMSMIGTGKTLKEIAEAVSLSVSTVNTYRSRVLRKLNLTNNAQLIHYCLVNKLIV